MLPVLFCASKALIDTVDSVRRVGAYGGSCFYPLRKLFYNLTLSAMSVIVAAFLGALEILGLLERFCSNTDR